MGEEGNGNDDDHTLPVTGGSIEGRPANVGGDGAVELNTSLDLVVLKEHKGISLIAVSVVVSEGLQSLRLPALGDEPTRRLRCEQDKEELENGRKTLEDGGDAPCPVVGDELRTESGPRGTRQDISTSRILQTASSGSHDVTGVPEGVVQGGQLGTVRGIGELGDQHGSSVRGKSQTESDEETARHW